MVEFAGLKLEGLRYTEAEFTLAADLAIPAGSRVAVIGPSGAGKSTLFNLISGFLDPMQGRVLWGDLDITGLAPGNRPIAMLFQDNNLFPHLSAEQNVGLGLRPDLRLSSDQRQQVRDALLRVGLDGFETRKPGQLSGGQQSRVALARLMVQSRPLILMDEPFAALGPALKTEMLDLVSDLAAESNATVLMISHDPEDARRFASMSVLVADGVALEPHPTDDLLDNPPPVLRDYLGS